MLAKVDSMIYIGLDIETSDLKIDDNAKIIQLGLSCIVAGRPVVFSSMVKNEGETFISEESFSVHGISAGELVSAPSLSEVEYNAIKWLEELVDLSESEKLIAVGWNVNSYDLPFINKFMPNLRKFFSHRVVELNSLCYLLGGSSHFEYRSSDSIKLQAKNINKKLLGEFNVIGDEHDAGYDAALGLMIFAYFKNIVN